LAHGSSGLSQTRYATESQDVTLAINTPPLLHQSKPGWTNKVNQKKIEVLKRSKIVRIDAEIPAIPISSGSTEPNLQILPRGHWDKTLLLYSLAGAQYCLTSTY